MLQVRKVDAASHQADIETAFGNCWFSIILVADPFDDPDGDPWLPEDLEAPLTNRASWSNLGSTPSAQPLPGCHKKRPVIKRITKVQREDK